MFGTKQVKFESDQKPSFLPSYMTFGKVPAPTKETKNYTGTEDITPTVLGTSSRVPIKRELIVRGDEWASVDHGLIQARQTFGREELPAAYDLPLDWHSAPLRTKFDKPSHRGVQQDTEEDPYQQVRDDDDVWNRLADNHDADKTGGVGKKGDKRKLNRDGTVAEDIEFISNDVNQHGTVDIFEAGGGECKKKFIQSLRDFAPDAPFIDIPGLEGEPIIEDINMVPECRTWKEIVTTRGTNVNIKVFDMSLYRPDFTLVVFGKRRTGKTQFLRHFMKAFRPYFPEVYVFTKTKSDNEYQRFVPDKFIFNGYQDNVIQAIIDRQERRMKHMREVSGENDQNIDVLLILDDCIDDDVLRYAKTTQRIFYNGRHIYVSIAINSQDHKAIKPGLRTNTDMVVCFPVRSQRDKEAIRENYADFIKNDSDFEEVEQFIHESPYTIMFIDQSRPYMDPGECVYAGIAGQDKDIGAFFMGTRDFWRGSETQAMAYEGAEDWLLQEDWGITTSTYKFVLNRLPDGTTMKLDKPLASIHQGSCTDESDEDEEKDEQ